jgi:hypothetical protein
MGHKWTKTQGGLLPVSTPASGPLTRKGKHAGDTALPIRTAQIPLGLPPLFPPPLPPSSQLPLRLLLNLRVCRHPAPPLLPSPRLALRRHPASLSAVTLPPLFCQGAGGGTDHHQIRVLALSLHRAWNWGSHAHPIPLPAMARSVRCGIGGQIDPVFRLRSQRCAGNPIWWLHLWPGPRIPGSHEVMQGAEAEKAHHRPGRKDGLRPPVVRRLTMGPGGRTASTPLSSGRRVRHVRGPEPCPLYGKNPPFPRTRVP